MFVCLFFSFLASSMGASSSFMANLTRPTPPRKNLSKWWSLEAEKYCHVNPNQIWTTTFACHHVMLPWLQFPQLWCITLGRTRLTIVARITSSSILLRSGGRACADTRMSFAVLRWAGWWTVFHVLKLLPFPGLRKERTRNELWLLNPF